MSDLLFDSEEISKEYEKLTRKKRRITHCYKCKEPIDCSVNVECPICRWVVCRCGVCGCGVPLN